MRFLRIAEVEKTVGYRKSKLYEMIAAGKFPRPVPLSDDGKSRAWVSTEIEAWQQARIAVRDAQAA